MQARSELGTSVHNESPAGRGSPGGGSFKSKKPLAIIATPDLDLWAQLGPMLESTVALRHADSLATAASLFKPGSRTILVADLRGRRVRPYRHSSLGVVATLGLGRGIFEFRGIVVKGFPAWLMHRGYHVLAVPTWERKIRVLAVWLTAALFGRDLVSLASVQHPREAFLAGAAAGERRATPVVDRAA